MLTKHTMTLSLIILGVALAVVSCSAPAPTATPTPRPAAAQPTDTPAQAPASPTDTPVPAPSGATAAELADLGQAAYAASCAGCHGGQGEGGRAPAVVGEEFAASKYASAQALYDKNKNTMPKTAPGSLSDEEYLQITTWLLLENEFVQADTVIDADQLGDIALSK